MLTPAGGEVAAQLSTLIDSATSDLFQLSARLAGLPGDPALCAVEVVAGSILGLARLDVGEIIAGEFARPTVEPIEAGPTDEAANVGCWIYA